MQDAIISYGSRITNYFPIDRIRLSNKKIYKQMVNKFNPNATTPSHSLFNVTLKITHKIIYNYIFYIIFRPFIRKISYKHTI